MKSIGLSDEVYRMLLGMKHNFEEEDGKVVSYDEVIRKLINKNSAESNVSM